MFGAVGPGDRFVLGRVIEAHNRQHQPAFRLHANFHLPHPVLVRDLASPSAPAIDALPTSVLVDRDGRPAKSYIGVVRETVFRADVDRLLAEHPAPSSNIGD
jgi:cytochrome c biogenesis protein CcmG/thiol:disulfide interchange protein DsbE